VHHNIAELKINRLKLSSTKLKRKYPKRDSNGDYRELPLRRRGTAPFREDRPYLYFPFVYDPSNKKLQVIDKDSYKKIYDGVNFNDEYVENLHRRYQERGLELIFPIREDGRLGRWRWGYDKCVRVRIPEQSGHPSGAKRPPFRGKPATPGVR